MGKKEIRLASPISDIEDIKVILTLEFIKAVENRKRNAVKNRNLTMKDYEFSKKFCLCKISFSHLLKLIATKVQCFMVIESQARA